MFYTENQNTLCFLYKIWLYLQHDNGFGAYLEIFRFALLHWFLI